MTITTSVAVFVPGRPAAQGSKRHLGKGVMVEQSTAVGPWRERVAYTVRQQRGPAGLLRGAVALRLEFVMPRPASCPKRSTPAAIKRPDVDKLSRAVLDAITHMVLADDAQVVDLHASKRLAELGEDPGCHITITEAL